LCKKLAFLETIERVSFEGILLVSEVNTLRVISLPTGHGRKDNAKKKFVESLRLCALACGLSLFGSGSSGLGVNG
jgi:hypothetical protein